MKWEKIRSVIIIIAAMLFAMSVFYIVYCKTKILFNLK